MTYRRFTKAGNCVIWKWRRVLVLTCGRPEVVPTMVPQTKPELSIATLVLSLGAFGCGSEPTYLDLNQPIAIVPIGLWTDQQIDVMRDAARAWNAEFGTDLRVGRDADGLFVPIQQSDSPCERGAGAVTNLVDSKSIQVCPSVRSLFDVVLHELGHVLNIHTHARSPYAVMCGTNLGFSLLFQPEDHSLFRLANPDFVARSDCRITYKIAESFPSSDWHYETSSYDPAVVPTNNHGAILFWPENDRLRFSAVDADYGSPHGVSGAILTDGLAYGIQGFSNSSGPAVLWLQGGQLKLARLSSSLEAQPMVLPTVGLPLPADLWDVSAVSLDSDIFVSVTDVYGSTLSYRFDSESGHAKSFGLAACNNCWRRLAVTGKELFVVERTYCPESSPGLFIRRLSKNGAITESLSLATHGLESWWSHQNSQVVAEAEAKELVVLSRDLDQSLATYRIATGAELSLLGRAEVPPPTGKQSEFRKVSLTRISTGWLLAITGAGNCSTTSYQCQDEAYYTILNPLTLKPTSNWQPLSVADNLVSGDPIVVALNGKLAAYWIDVYHDLNVRTIRGRCLPARNTEQEPPQ